MTRFFEKIREPFLIAFSTASSEAALPRALERIVEFGVPKSVAGFVLPAGYSFNLDGSTLYIVLATLTIAQAAGRHLSILEQVTMCLVFMLTTKGVAAVPRAALVIIAAGCASLRPAGRGGRRDDPRRGRADGHGPHVDQPRRQLRRRGRRREVGGRLRRRKRERGRAAEGGRSYASPRSGDARDDRFLPGRLDHDADAAQKPADPASWTRPSRATRAARAPRSSSPASSASSSAPRSRASATRCPSSPTSTRS